MWVTRARRFWNWLVGRSPSDREIDDELEAFVEMLGEEKVRAGASPEEARRAAHIESGGIVQVAEDVRDVRPAAFFDRLKQDLTYGVRLFRRAPGLNAAVVVALALGIGATSATFSVVHAVLLRPLDYANADDLVVVLHNDRNPVSPANLLDWQRENRVFATMGAAEYWTPNLGGTSDPEKLFALRVTSEILPMLGVPPARGRFPADGDAGSHEVVIGDGLWRRVFGGDPSVVGRQIRLDGSPYVVVGVMPPQFAFAPFWATRAELWAPLMLGPRASQRGGNSLRVFARLRPGVTIEQARASMATLTAELESRYPGTNRNVTVTSLKEKVVGNVRLAIVVLFAGVGLVLLVACANVAHLLLARASAREREVALRAALGAGRARLVRQFLTESLILALAGGAAGVALGVWAISLFKTLGATSIPRAHAVAFDGTVLTFTVGLSLATAMLFGLAPALKLSRPELTTALREADRGSTSGRRSRRVRNLLIGSEVALAIMLLLGAAVLLRSFIALRTIDPGWNPDRLLSMVVSVTGTADESIERRSALYVQILDRLGKLPGVQASGAINHVPLIGDIWGLPFVIEGRPEPRPGETPTAAYRQVLPGYFRTMELPIVLGRDFTDDDRASSTPVVIVNQTLAAAHWPGEDPLGKRIQIYRGPWATVVGVARNAVRRDWQAPPDDEVYVPLFQQPQFPSYLSYVIRTTGNPADLVPSTRAAVRALTSTASISDVVVMRQAVREATLSAQFIVVLLSAFAGMALILASVGIYGVMSHAVSMRRHEIGVRLALGATRHRIVSGIVAEGLVVTVCGAAAGVAGTFALSGALSGLLSGGVTMLDIPSFVIATTTLVATSIVACYLPARRASRIEPQHELR